MAALKLMSESSLSGTDLAKQLDRVSSGTWRPGPGSVYLILKDLRAKGLITELPRRGGNTRRYVVTGKGKDELARASREFEGDLSRQLSLLATYSDLVGKEEFGKSLASLAAGLLGNQSRRKG